MQGRNRERDGARAQALNARLLSSAKTVTDSLSLPATSKHGPGAAHFVLPLPERRILSLARINWLALGDYRPTAVFDLLFSSCLA
jgi:hypothetical protein